MRFSPPVHAGGIQATYNAAAQRVENTLAARAIIHLSPERVDEAHVQQTLHDAEMRNSIRLKLKARTLKLKAEKEAFQARPKSQRERVLEEVVLVRHEEAGVLREHAAHERGARALVRVRVR